MNTLVTVLALVICVLVVGIMLTLFAVPEMYARFWKSMIRGIKRSVGLPTFTAEQEEAKAKAARLAPYQHIVNKIEQIIPGETLRYKIPETWGGSFVAVQRNPQHPQNGRKYLLCIEDGIQGMPGGEKTVMYDSDEPLVLAASIVARGGELFTASGEKSIGTTKSSVAAS